MLPSITQANLGFPSAPGEYTFNGAHVKVDAFHIAAWKLTPDAAFNSVLVTRIGDKSVRLALGRVVVASI